MLLGRRLTSLATRGALQHISHPSHTIASRCSFRLFNKAQYSTLNTKQYQQTLLYSDSNNSDSNIHSLIINNNNSDILKNNSNSSQTNQENDNDNDNDNNELPSKYLFNRILETLDEKSLSPDEIKKLNQYKEDAQMNESLVDFHIGTFYSQGIVLEKDQDKAIFYYKKAADKDLAEAQYAYGLTLIKGTSENLFTPIFPSLIDNSSTLSTTKSLLDDMILGKGWVSPSNNETDKDFDYYKWLRQERRKFKVYRDNKTKIEKSKRDNLKTGIRWLTLSAIQNYTHAQFSLGLLLLKGNYEVDVNETQGIYWLEKADQEGDVNATYELANYYYNAMANDIENSNLYLEKAIPYYLKGSNAGHAECSYWLGSNFIDNQDSSGINGLEFLLLAIEQQSKPAPTFLSILYRNGVIVEQDKQTFIKYLEMGVDRQDSTALLMMGELYFSGDEGFELNYKKAFQFFKSSSLLGNSNASLNLGVMHFNGFGTPIDYLQAFYCYQNAYHYDSTNISAISNLYTMHRDGLGVPKNVEMAEYYLGLLKKLENINNS
ncbi:hypothetical protein CYY_002362 [Polysphondylium violaceum]|uniref:Uncharacterized protein n=1 Tax=Polysphondylium violaceum TaxID=133409 RepID=A0A8J4PYL0_9MYCE|nr:hypothetical protein CYY_002362 [Polysphondylium violaceum]